jgi:hypothetical protein
VVPGQDRCHAAAGPRTGEFGRNGKRRSLRRFAPAAESSGRRTQAAGATVTSSVRTSAVGS